MKTTPLLTLLTLFCLTGCYVAAVNTADDDCSFARDVVVESAGCYDPARGLTLRATGYSAQPVGWQWEIYATPDTAAAENMIQQFRQASPLTTLPTITLSDTLLRRFPKVYVALQTNCGGRLLTSPEAFSFVRRQVGGCTVWARQRRR